MSEFVLVTIDRSWDKYIADSFPHKGLGDAVQELMEFVTEELTDHVSGRHVLISLTAGSLMPPGKGPSSTMKGPSIGVGIESKETTSSWWKN